MNNTRVIEGVKQTHQKAEQIQHPPPSSGSGCSAATASPPSASSSPSHEFSFTISLHPTNSTKPPDNKKPQNPNSNSNQNPFAIDLTPADEIFFHGHLLPLHLLSHLPVSPRSSTNSIDTSLPINKDSLSDPKSIQKSINHCELNHDYDDDNHTYYDLNHSFHYLNHHHQTNSFNIPKDHQKPKSKSFSLFGLPKWKKGEKEKTERKLKFDVSQVIKRYMKMMRPFLSFSSSRKNMQFHRQSCSYSGNLSFRSKGNNNGSNSHKGIKRGAYSAPVSMKNSPTNSGLLVATPGGHYGNSSSSSSGDSTMEELQAAIQAAIAHCKKSSSMEEKKIK
ncbi:unnamed protein product [Withania somnifera]